MSKLHLDLEQMLTELVQSEIEREYEMKKEIYRRDGGRKMAIGHITLKLLQHINRELSADRHRVDYLEVLNGSYTGRVLLRMSSNGRGFRLHETSRDGAYKTTREAIDAHMREHPELEKEILP